MPQSLQPIPIGTPITEEDGRISTFFRLRWQALIDGFQLSPNVAQAASATALIAAATPTTSAYTTRAGGLYRVSYYMRKTVADGVSSSLTFTWGWSENGIPLTEAAAALTLDTTGAQQSGGKVILADATTDLTFAIAYASNTPGLMKYLYNVVVEQLA